MKRSMKTIFFFALFASVFAITSCVKSDEDRRTADIETTEITNFILKLKEAGSNVDTTASGMYYIIHKLGSGASPTIGDSVFIEYVGYYINGVIFDASAFYHANGIWGTVYGGTSLIEGFDEAIGMMHTGGEATFIIPSKLAYGAAWYDNIPPYTPLVFDLNLYESNTKPNENQ